MMRIIYGRDFLKAATRLPISQQKKLSKLLLVLAENPFHSALHTKHLSGNFTGMLSFRITREWRVIFSFIDEELVQLVDVGHRKDIYRG